MMRTSILFTAATFCCAMAASASAQTTTTTFANGTEGWRGNAMVDASLGNAAPAFHSQVENFGINWTNDSNAAFLGNLTQSSSVGFGVDTLTRSITFLGSEVTRNFFVKLIDLGATADSADDLTLYYKLGTLTAADAGSWKSWGVTIADTSGAIGSSGWGLVNGDGEIVTDPARSFADVLASVDQITFDTYEPDYFYGFQLFDVAGDNFAITRGAAAVPEPASWALMLVGFAAVGGVLRRRRAVLRLA